VNVNAGGHQPVEAWWKRGNSGVNPGLCRNCNATRTIWAAKPDYPSPASPNHLAPRRKDDMRSP